MDAFPAYFPLRDRRVAVAGDGAGLEARLRLLAGSPADLIRLSGLEAHDPEAYRGAILAFIASDDEAWATAAAAAARSAGVPVNVMDRPALCDFTTPAVIDRGEVVAAVGTGGGAPAFAALLRQDIEARIPEGAGRVAALFRGLQDEVRRALPEPAARRAFLRGAMAGPAASAAMAGDMAGAARLVREALTGEGAASGTVRYVSGEGPVDLLTLRAARALANADILICDPGVDLKVVALARRDAEHRIGLTTEAIAALARGGAQVVRVTTADQRLEQALLHSLGAVVEIAPSATGA